MFYDLKQYYINYLTWRKVKKDWIKPYSDVIKTKKDYNNHTEERFAVVNSARLVIGTYETEERAKKIATKNNRAFDTLWCTVVDLEKWNKREERKYLKEHRNDIMLEYYCFRDRW